MHIPAEFTRELDRFSSPEELRRSILAPFQETLDTASEVYLFGASRLGRKFLSYCAASHFSVKGFLDNNPDLWGKNLDGVQVFPPHDVRDLATPVFVVSGYLTSITRQLNEMGFRHVIPFPILFLFSGVFEPELGYGGMCEELILNKCRFVEALRHFPEKRSRKVLNHVILFRMSFNPECLVEICDSDNNTERYFGHPFFKIPENPVFIDGGGYDGDSTRDFIDWCSGKYRKVLLFEPDPILIQRARARLDHQPNVEFLSCGLHSRAGTLRFSATQGLDGRISQEGEALVEVKSIDEFIDHDISIIKLDIEGAEEDALAGAVNTIRALHPVLLISVYHRPSDLWKLPEIILKIHPDYDFFLRHFSQSNVATVLFAVPRK